MLCLHVLLQRLTRALSKFGQFALHWPSRPSPAFGSPNSDVPAPSRSMKNTAHIGSLPPSTPSCTHYVFVAEERERVRLELHLSAPPPNPHLSATNFARYRDPFSSANQKLKGANGCERMLRVYGESGHVGHVLPLFSHFSWYFVLESWILHEYSVHFTIVRVPKLWSALNWSQLMVSHLTNNSLKYII